MAEATAFVIAWAAGACWAALGFGILALRRDGQEPHRYHSRAALISFLVFAVSALTYIDLR